MTSTQCGTPMKHPDGTVSPCVRHPDHRLQDTDHRDEHGHTAPVLVHQSTIEEIRRWQGVPFPWER